jgi:hypothetical protein
MYDYGKKESQVGAVAAEHDEGPVGQTMTDVPLVLADDVAYGPDGIRGLLGSGYVFGAAFLASLGGFSFWI